MIHHVFKLCLKLENLKSLPPATPRLHHLLDLQESSPPQQETEKASGALHSVRSGKQENKPRTTWQWVRSLVIRAESAAGPGSTLPDSVTCGGWGGWCKEEGCPGSIWASPHTLRASLEGAAEEGASCPRVHFGPLARVEGALVLPKRAGSERLTQAREAQKCSLLGKQNKTKKTLQIPRCSEPAQARNRAQGKRKKETFPFPVTSGWLCRQPGSTDIVHLPLHNRPTPLK